MKEIPTKPYVLRALFEWCVDNGYTPHLAVKVDSRTQVPPEYAAPLAEHRSPLLLNDGRAVKTPADWQKRRAEILADWHRLMGAWPPVVEHPRIDRFRRAAPLEPGRTAAADRL